MDITEQSPVSLAVCPGILGIERGLKRVFPKLRTAAYVEIETFIVENILTAMETGMVDAAPIWTNLKTFNPEPFRGLIDILSGGYPCQPFSLAGNRGGINDPRHLWPYLYKITDTIRPFCCFFENVAGHLSMGYAQVYRDLRSLGYRVETGIYTASEVGAPHQRERLFILAVLENSNGYGSGRFDQGRLQSEAVRTSEGMGNNESENREIFTQRKDRDSTRAIELLKSKGRSSTGTDDRFPAGQGAFQYEWEEPRTIESGMEYTINGYNFMEDLHRAIGNSVVEQTAEVAFRDLWNKLFPNNKI